MITIGCKEVNNKWTPDLVGYVHVWEGDIFLYELKSSVRRTNKRDAIEDAEKMRRELLEEKNQSYSDIIYQALKPEIF